MEQLGTNIQASIPKDIQQDETGSAIRNVRVGIHDLPNELMLDILDYIGSDDIATLHALCLSSYQLHSFFEQALYSKFPGRNPARFLQSIVHPTQNKEAKLAKRVKVLDWTYGTKGDRHALNELARTEPYMSVHTAALAASKSNEKAEHARLPVDTDLLHCWVDFFALFTPNVEKIIVQDAWQWDDHSVWLPHMTLNASKFAHLSSMIVHGPLRIENVCSLLDLPALKSLELTQVVDMRRDPDKTYLLADLYSERTPDAKRDSPIEHLVLRDCDSNMEVLDYMLLRIRALESFTYEYRPNGLSCRSKNAHSNLCMYKHLGLHGHSLQHIRIRDHSRRIALDDLDSVLRCLHDPEPRSWFSDLKTLDIGPLEPRHLNHHHLLAILPNSLVDLRIKLLYDLDLDAFSPRYLSTRRLGKLSNSTYLIQRQETRASHTHNVLADFYRALTSHRHLAPHLRSVTIVDWPALAGWYARQRKLRRLRAGYAELGIDVSVVSERIDGPEPFALWETTEPGWVWVYPTTNFADYLPA